MIETEENISRKLPDGWYWVRLGDVCEIIMGQSPESRSYNSVGQGVPLLNGPTEFGPINPIKVQWTTEPTHFAVTGDILLCVRGATTGRKNIADQRYCIGRGLAAIRGKLQLATTGFLWFALDLVTATLLGQASGSTFPNLPGEKLKSIVIPLPPFSEQQRIVAILNEQMTAVQKARAAAKAQLKAAGELPAAYLRNVFESSEAQQWPRKRLGDVGEIASGITLGRKLNGAKTRIVPYLRVANVKDGCLDLSDVYEIEATEAEIQKCRLIFGDMLLTEGGDPDKLGRGTFWEEQMTECIHQNHIFRVRFDLDQFLPQFISAQIGSPYGKAYFLAHAKQTTGIATINQKVLANFPLMIPTLTEQERIASILVEKTTEVERMRNALKEQLDTINKLPAILLRRAFNGEL